MTSATLYRNIIVNMPDAPGEIVIFYLLSWFAAAGTEGFAKKKYELTLDASGQGVQALPVPPDNAWLYRVSTPDGKYKTTTLAAGADLQLTTWLASAQSTVTAASLADQFAALSDFVAHEALELGVHGIADTSLLETVSGAQAKADAAEAKAVAASEPDLGNPLVDGHVLSSTIAGSRSWVAGGGGGGSGDFLADGSVPMTDTLELESIGDGGSATVLQIPVSSADGANFNFNIASALFIDTYDTTFNLGFNNAVAGAAVAGKHAWYLQMEYDYNEGGAHYAEYHLNLFNAGGSVNYRPFQFKYKTDGSSGSISYRATNVSFISADGLDTVLVLADAGLSTKAITVSGIINLRPTVTSDQGLYITGSSSVTVFAMNAISNTMEWRTLSHAWKTTAGATVLYLDNNVKSLSMYGNINILPTTDLYGLFIRPSAGFTHTKMLIDLRNSANTQLFAIGPAGQIRTNQDAPNTATPSGATAHQLPIYNEAGTLLGYIPIYAAAWT